MVTYNIIQLIVILFPTEYKQLRKAYMSNIITTRKLQTLMVLLVVTREARGSSSWQPKSFAGVFQGWVHMGFISPNSSTKFKFYFRNGLVPILRFPNMVTEFAYIINTLRSTQNGCHFVDDIFKCIFMNEKFDIIIDISLKFVPKGSINNSPALVQKMAWCPLGDKPLPEPMPTQFTGASMQH